MTARRGLTGSGLTVGIDCAAEKARRCLALLWVLFFRAVEKLYVCRRFRFVRDQGLVETLSLISSFWSFSSKAKTLSSAVSGRFRPRQRLSHQQFLVVFV